MKLKELSQETVIEIYNQHMIIDFPQDELKPLKRILDMMTSGLCCAYGIYEQDNLRGYALFIIPDGLRYGLIDYLAVLKEYRGTGVGHVFFALIGETLTAKYPLLKGFFIESEDIAYAADAKERLTREKRISFYTQNNCVMTTLGSRLFGVTYSILVYEFGTKTETMVSREDLNNIYLAMFSKHHYEHDVDLWDKGKSETEICIRDVSKSFENKTVFHHLNMTIKNNETTCIMAPSGAGKTTLLRILMGLEKVDSGSVSGLEGRRFSAVFQEERLCEHMTVQDNIRLVTPDLDSDTVVREMSRLGLGDCCNQPVSELSGGMRRRVSILRALMAAYEVLFLDEPFKGLDDVLKEQVLAYVREKTVGKTVIFVTHDRKEASALGAKVIELNKISC